MPPTSTGCRGLTGVQFYSGQADVKRMRQLEHESKVCVNNANLITKPLSVAMGNQSTSSCQVLP